MTGELSDMELRASLIIRTALGGAMTDDRWCQLENLVERLNDVQSWELEVAAGRVHEALARVREAAP